MRYVYSVLYLNVTFTAVLFYSVNQRVISPLDGCLAQRKQQHTQGICQLISHATLILLIIGCPTWILGKEAVRWIEMAQDHVH